MSGAPSLQPVQPMAQPITKRRVKLIQPRLQLWLISVFSGIAILSLTLQFVLFGARLADIGAHMPDGGVTLAELTPRLLMDTLLMSVLVLLPLTFGVGVLVTFRFAGPLYRMHRYLEGLAAGTETGPCALRKNDELSEFCEALNKATAPLWSQAQQKEREAA